MPPNCSEMRRWRVAVGGRQPLAVFCYTLFTRCSRMRVFVCVYLAFGTPTICFSHDMSSSLNSRRGLTVFRQKLDFRSHVAVFFAEAHIGNEVTFSFRFLDSLFFASFFVRLSPICFWPHFCQFVVVILWSLALHSSRVWRKQFFSFQLNGTTSKKGEKEKEITVIGFECSRVE